MKFAFFLGCVIPVKFPHFERVTRDILNILEVELVDLPFSCCPAPTNMKLAHYDSWLALAARNLVLAEEKGLDLITICNGCVNTLKEANLILKQEPKRRKRVNAILEEYEKSYQGTVEVFHLLDVLTQEEVLSNLKEAVKDPVPISFGCHYGCHFYRPPRMMYPDDLSPAASYVPQHMDLILSVLGARSLDYSRKFLCCGSALGLNVDPEAANDITREKLFHMKKRDIEAVAVTCPACFLQFDRGQMMLERKYKDHFNLPTLHISQIIGLALGLPQDKLGLGEHRIKVEPLLSQRLSI